MMAACAKMGLDRNFFMKGILKEIYRKGQNIERSK